MKSLDAIRSDLRSEEMPPPPTLARSIGWFSLALGAAELAAPRILARVVGLEPSARTALVVRLVGATKIAAGIGVLLRSRRPHANRPIIYSVTINKPPSEVYDFFRDFERLPRFMDYLDEVEVRDHKRSRWIAKPFGMKQTVAWEAEIVEDVPGELIAWQSVDGSMIKTNGRVTFAKAPGRNATEVRVEMQLGVTGIGPSAALATFFSKPQIKGDLRRLKQVLETGEVLISDATVTRRPHPAQPSEPETIEANKKHEYPLFAPNAPTAQKGVV